MCGLWSAAQPSQNKRRKARPTKTEGRIGEHLLEDDGLDIGEELPINALPELTTRDDKRKQTPRHLVVILPDTSARFSHPHSVCSRLRVFAFVLFRLLPPHALI